MRWLVLLILPLVISAPGAVGAKPSKRGAFLTEAVKFEKDMSRDQIEKRLRGCTYDARSFRLRCPMKRLGLTEHLTFDLVANKLRAVRVSFLFPGDWAALEAKHAKVMTLLRGGGPYVEFRSKTKRRPYSLPGARERLEGKPASFVTFTSERDVAGGRVAGQVLAKEVNGRQYYGFTIQWIYN